MAISQASFAAFYEMDTLNNAKGTAPNLSIFGNAAVNVATAPTLVGNYGTCSVLTTGGAFPTATATNLFNPVDNGPVVEFTGWVYFVNPFAAYNHTLFEANAFDTVEIGLTGLSVRLGNTAKVLAYAAGSPTLNRWHFFRVGWRTDGAIRASIRDSVSKAELLATTSDTCAAPTTTGALTFTFAQVTAVNRRLDGRLDQIGVLNRLPDFLSDVEVLGLFNNGAGIAFSDLPPTSGNRRKLLWRRLRRND